MTNATVIDATNVNEIEVVGMEQLIKIETDKDTGEALVSGRELHERLEVKSKYVDWFKRMTEYGFAENEDFVTINEVSQKKEGSRTVNREQINHVLKLDMAKEIAMLQRNEEGKKIRKYLLEVEKAWNSPEKIMQRALLIAQSNINRLEAQVEEMKPKATFADMVDCSVNSINVGEMAKILKAKGLTKMGANQFFDWLRLSGYLMRRNGDNVPTQRSINMKIMEIKENVVGNGDKSLVRITPKITGKGQRYFVDKFVNMKEER